MAIPPLVHLFYDAIIHHAPRFEKRGLPRKTGRKAGRFWCKRKRRRRICNIKTKLDLKMTDLIHVLAGNGALHAISHKARSSATSGQTEQKKG
ncbi:MAG: hypothetical protein RR296_06925 [Clostridia bacterium]